MDIGQTTNNIKQTAQSISTNVNQGFESVKTNVGNTISQFGDPRALATNSSDFLTSNTIVAKVAITLLVLIVFVLLVILGVNLIGYFTNKDSANPYIVKGMIGATSGYTVPGSTVQRSDNKKYGIEFTWSVWLQINDVVPPAQQYAHIFNKGNGGYDLSANKTYPMGTGIATVNNAPGVYLANGTNPGNVSLHIVMDTVDPTIGPITIDVPGLPLNKKWMHVALRLENTILDVYINGTISGRYSIEATPKQNYGDVQVCQNGGFSGFLSDLRYYSSALSAYEINQIVGRGPNTTQSSLASSTKGNAYYLSNNWYFSKLT